MTTKSLDCFTFSEHFYQILLSVFLGRHVLLFGHLIGRYRSTIEYVFNICNMIVYVLRRVFSPMVPVYVMYRNINNIGLRMYTGIRKITPKILNVFNVHSFHRIHKP